MPDSIAPTRDRVVAIIPVGTLAGAKSRLGAVLDAEERLELPDVSTEAIDAVLATLDDPRRPLVANVPDRHRRGTNALLLAPPDTIDTCFDGDSRAAHAAAAREAGAALVELDGPLTLNLDTP